MPAFCPKTGTSSSWAATGSVSAAKVTDVSNVSSFGRSICVKLTSGMTPLRIWASRTRSWTLSFMAAIHRHFWRLAKIAHLRTAHRANSPIVRGDYRKSATDFCRVIRMPIPSGMPTAAHARMAVSDVLAPAGAAVAIPALTASERSWASLRS